MAIPRKSSTLNIFYWWPANSDGSRFKLHRTAWVEDLSPKHTDPCLTASIAYSTWNSLPWGDQVTQSRSYDPFSIKYYLKYFKLTIITY